MASFSCAVKFGRFKWDRSGYAALMNSSGVQSLVQSHANATFRAACSALGKGDYKVYPVRGRLANGYQVRATSYHARLKEARRGLLAGCLQ